MSQVFRAYSIKCLRVCATELKGLGREGFFNQCGHQRYFCFTFQYVNMKGKHLVGREERKMEEKKAKRLFP